MIKRIYEHLITKGKYNKLDIAYTILEDRYEKRGIELDTQKKINKIEKEKFEQELEELLEKLKKEKEKNKKVKKSGN